MILDIGRLLTALLLVVGLSLPGLDACFCGLLTTAPEDCCAGFEEEGNGAAGPVLDDGPCCCCSVEPLAEAPAPSQWAFTVPVDEGPAPAMAPTVFAGVQRGPAFVGAERPPPGPDPSPPAAIVLRRTVVLIV